MTENLKQALLSLAQCLSLPNHPGGSIPIPVDTADIDAWRNAVANNSDSPLWQDDAHNLRIMLHIARNHPQFVEHGMWGMETTSDNDITDPSLAITRALLDYCKKPAWLRIRLVILAYIQENKIVLDAFTAQFGLEQGELLKLRDAALLRYMAKTHPELSEDAMFNDPTDRSLASVRSSLDDVLDAEKREILTGSADVREILEQANIDIDACVAADVALDYAASRITLDDPKTAALADLAADLLLSGSPITDFFPDTDNEKLIRALLKGETQLLAQIADGRNLIKIMLKALAQSNTPKAAPPAWLETVTKDYWTPFTNQLLNRTGPAWLLDAMCLIAAVRNVDKETPNLPDFLLPFENALQLLAPAPGQDELAGKTRLQMLCEALLDLDVQQFRANILETQQIPLAISMLCNPPVTDPATMQLLGLEKNIDIILLEQCLTSQEPSPGNAKLQLVYDLINHALRQRKTTNDALLNLLESAPEIPFTKAQLIENLMHGNSAAFEQIPTADLIRFLQQYRYQLESENINFAPLNGIDATIATLRETHYHELLAQLPTDVARNDHSAIQVIWRRINSEVSDNDLTKAYDVDRAYLDQLQSDFYQGVLPALAGEVPVKVPPPINIQSVEGERVRSTLLKIFTRLNLRLALLVILIGGYLAFHYYILSQPTATADAAPPTETPQLSTDEFFAELPTMRQIESQGHTILIAPLAVTNAEFQDIMYAPASLDAVTGATGSHAVKFVTYEEAREYCQRWTDYAHARCPQAFIDNPGYVFRLPFAREAALLPCQPLQEPAVDAEWISVDNPDSACVDSNGQSPINAQQWQWIESRPVRMFQGNSDCRPLAEDRTTFRMVFAPANMDTNNE
ncbi:MAG: hypothetical protein JW936_02930 [Sedimentisphaerales bacterium]|nr:hypothetical protein [Sedimentisphaerales bacterium]